MKYTRFAILSLLTPIAALTALAETPITSCPFTINAPGNYILTTDLTCGTSGITITASNVSLKLNGHKITVPSEASAVIAIAVDGESAGRVNHVGIQGPGLITSPVPPGDFPTGALSVGISLRSVDYSQVSQVTIMGALGIDGDIKAVNCNFLTLTSNVLGRSGNGVSMYNTNSSSVTGNDTSGNFVGIYLTGSGNTVTNNIANGNSFAGIVIDGGVRVSGNVTNGNDSYGIWNLSTISQTFSNTSKANGLFDLFDQNACGGSWSDNVFLTANAPCIH